MVKLKNKKVGARVIVREITAAINPQIKWKMVKNVSGIIVERGDHEQYYHTCSGGHTHINKHIILNDCFDTYAVKLDDGVVDIEGNNIIVEREFDLKFLDYLPTSVKVITKKEYNKALKLIEEYDHQQTLK